MNPSIKSHLKEIDQLARQLGESIYLVGGTVRDHLLGRTSSDLDFTSHKAPEIARVWSQKIKKPCVPLDETPGRETYRVPVDQNLYYDFTTLQGKTIEEDLAQRDFTINAMAIHLSDYLEQKPNFIDPFLGKKDLQQKIIRTVREQVLEEDPLRLLRAFRFVCTFEFEIELNTLHQIKKHQAKLNQVAMERISHEFLILLKANHSQLGLLEAAGVLEILFPDIRSLKNKQGNQANCTQWDDTLNVIREMENVLLQPNTHLEKHAQLVNKFVTANLRGALLKWSALIHLMPSTFGTTSATSDWLKGFRLSNADIQFIARTLKFSQILLSGIRSAAGGFKEDSKIYQFAHRSGNEMLSSILLSIAIRLGSQKDIKYFLPTVHRILDFYVQRYLPAKTKPILLDGDTLKNKFQLQPSPQFKIILEKVEEARVLGIIRTSKEAEALAKKLISSEMELIE